MAASNLQARLETISGWRQRAPDAALQADLEQALRDRQALVVAKAAEVAGELGLTALRPALVGAFDRVASRGLSGDKGCHAKQAIVAALLRLDHDDADLYRRAAAIVQMEPVWGGQVDTAAAMRGMAALGLVNSAAPDALPLLADLLGDADPECRCGAARALAHVHPPPAALALLHLRTLCGEDHGPTLSACFESMLSLDPVAALPRVERSLASDDAGRRDAAALALGQSRLRPAWPILRQALEHTMDGEARRTLMLGLAMLRHDEATDLLLETLAGGLGTDAAAAAEALAIHQHDPALRQRAAAALRQRGEVEPAVAEAARWVQA